MATKLDKAIQIRDLALELDKELRQDWDIRIEVATRTEEDKVTSSEAMFTMIGKLSNVLNIIVAQCNKLATMSEVYLPMIDEIQANLHRKEYDAKQSGRDMAQATALRDI